MLCARMLVVLANGVPVLRAMEKSADSFAVLLRGYDSVMTVDVDEDEAKRKLRVRMGEAEVYLSTGLAKNDKGR